MLISHLKLPPWLIVPKKVVSVASSHVEIVQHKFEAEEMANLLPMGNARAIEWVSCKRATPHVDEGFDGDQFLTISMTGGYEFGDVKVPLNTDYYLRKGSLFLVDPLVKHWLFHASDFMKPVPQTPWIGLQWIVPRKNVKNTVKTLIEFFNGIPIDAPEPRIQKVLSRET